MTYLLILEWFITCAAKIQPSSNTVFNLICCQDSRYEECIFENYFSDILSRRIGKKLQFHLQMFGYLEH